MQAESSTYPSQLNRILIIGQSGVGKTSLAAVLAARLCLPHVELDALHWEPNWTEASDAVMLERVDAALPADGSWITDGNYAKMRSIVWARGQTLVWLDYPLSLTMWRLFKRYVGRIIWRTDLWGTGNQESLWRLFSLDPDTNLFIHNVQTHASQRTRFEAALRQPEHAHLIVQRFQSPAETEDWLARLPAEEPLEKSLEDETEPSTS